MRPAAEDFSTLREFFESDTELNAMLAHWPTCPSCGKRRIVRCPVCKGTGDLFPPADTEFWDGSEPVSVANSTPVSHCGCGDGGSRGRGDGGGCHQPPPGDSQGLFFGEMPDLRKDPMGTLAALYDMPSITVTDTRVATANRRGDEEVPCAADENASANSLLRLVVCTVCDEPFVPQFFGGCVACRFSFDEGNAKMCDHSTEESEVDSQGASLDDEVIAHYRETVHQQGINGRVVISVVLMAVGFLAASAYTWWLFR